jgi:hypothetical protein
MSWLGKKWKDIEGSTAVKDFFTFGGATRNRHRVEAIQERERSAKASDAAMQKRWDEYLKGREEAEKPFREYGLDSLRRLRELEADPTSLTRQPGYQAGLKHITDTVAANSSASGDVLGGARQKRTTRYASDYYSQKYGEEWRRLAEGAGVAERSTVRSARDEGGSLESDLRGIRGVYGANADAMDAMVQNEERNYNENLDALRFYGRIAGNAAGIAI